MEYLCVLGFAWIYVNGLSYVDHIYICTCRYADVLLLRS